VSDPTRPNAEPELGYWKVTLPCVLGLNLLISTIVSAATGNWNEYEGVVWVVAFAMLPVALGISFVLSHTPKQQMAASILQSALIVWLVACGTCTGGVLLWWAG
jgi:hypothetical protein